MGSAKYRCTPITTEGRIFTDAETNRNPRKPSKINNKAVNNLVFEFRKPVNCLPELVNRQVRIMGIDRARPMANKLLGDGVHGPGDFQQSNKRVPEIVKPQAGQIAS